MTPLFYRSMMRFLGERFAVAVLVAGMALMAFAAGVVLLGVLIGLPLAGCIAAARQGWQSLR